MALAKLRDVLGAASAAERAASRAGGTAINLVTARPYFHERIAMRPSASHLVRSTPPAVLSAALRATEESLCRVLLRHAPEVTDETLAGIYFWDAHAGRWLLDELGDESAAACALLATCVRFPVGMPLSAVPACAFFILSEAFKLRAPPDVTSFYTLEPNVAARPVTAEEARAADLDERRKRGQRERTALSRLRKKLRKNDDDDDDSSDERLPAGIEEVTVHKGAVITRNSQGTSVRRSSRNN
jgi:hypothetical protein